MSDSSIQHLFTVAVALICLFTPLGVNRILATGVYSEDPLQSDLD